MTGTDIQQRFEAIIVDLQTVGKGLGIIIVFRNSNNAAQEFTLSSDNNGVTDDAERENLQTYIDEELKLPADDYNIALIPVTAASEALLIQQIPHQALIDAASAARIALQNALLAVEDYQQAKAVLEAARANPVFIEKRDVYIAKNVSENYAELANAKGKYI